MILFVIMLIGLFYAIILLMQKYNKFNPVTYLGGAAVVVFLYSLFAWRTGFSNTYIVVTALLALFSYLLFIYLVQKS